MCHFFISCCTYIVNLSSSKIPSGNSCKVTVTHGGKTASVDVKIFNTVKYIGFLESGKQNVWQGDKQENYKYEMFVDYSDGSRNLKDIETSKHSKGDGTLVYTDEKSNGEIIIYDYDINTVGVQEIKANYFCKNGSTVEAESIWVGVHSGASENGKGNAAANPIVGDIKSYIILSVPGTDAPRKFTLGSMPNWSNYYLSHKVYTYNSDKEEWYYFTPDFFVKDSNGDDIRDSNGNKIVENCYLMSSYNYLGGFDSIVTTPSYGNAFGLGGGDFYRLAYFEYNGWIITMRYTVKAVEAASYSLYDDYDYNEPVFEEEFPEETEVPEETDIPNDITDTENTGANSTESTVTETTVSDTEVTETTVTKPVVTEPVDTDTEVTEPTVNEPIVTEPTVTEPEVTETQVETSTVEEIPVLAIGDSGIFGFGRSGRKTAQYANLHKNDIYNYYVVRNASADILGKDNLLFVGQTSSDGNGSLSFEYETTTGEDGTVILRPMSDDPTTPDKPTTPDTPSDPTHPNNGGSSSNTAVIPVSATVTKTMTIKVENKITGETSKARGQKTGSSVTVKLGTENDGYYANVYTTDDKYICSAIIENGRAKFNVSSDIKLKIVIDSIAYGEDVSSGAGVFGDSVTESLPYAAITIVIAIVGIYFKKRSEKKVK